MAFTAPNLTTSLDATSYATQLNNNLVAIQNAFNQIQSTLAATAGIPKNTLGGLSNLETLAKMVQSGGVIGNNAFAISFNTLNTTATISHPDPVTGESNAIFTENSLGASLGVTDQTRWYRNGTTTTLTLTDAVTGLPNGTYNVCVGLKGEGSPNVTYAAVECATTLNDTNYETSGIDLALYTFDYVVNSGAYTVKNLRRACDVLVAHDSFKKAYEDEHALTVIMDDPLPSHSAAGGSYIDSMNTEGFMPTVGGLIVPWDCEVVKAYVLCDTLGSQTATDGWQFTLYEGAYVSFYDPPRGSGTAMGNTMEQIVDGPIYLNEDLDGGTQIINGFTQNKQLAAGTFIQPAIGPFNDPARALGTDAEPPTGLTITVVLKRHYEGIYA